MGKNPIYQQCLDEKKPHGKLYHQHQKDCKLPRKTNQSLIVQKVALKLIKDDYKPKLNDTEFVKNFIESNCEDFRDEIYTDRYESSVDIARKIQNIIKKEKNIDISDKIALQNYEKAYHRFIVKNILDNNKYQIEPQCKKRIKDEMIKYESEWEYYWDSENDNRKSLYNLK